MGDKWKTSMKSCGQSTESIQSLLGDKWETNGRQMGDKYRIMRTSGRQMGDKCEAKSLLGDKWETNGRQAEIMRASRAYWETTGRQVGDKWETSIKSCGQSTESIQSLLGDKWETRVKSCGQEHKNPSQVNLFGEKAASLKGIKHQTL